MVTAISIPTRPQRGDHQRGVNSWNEPKDKSFVIRGHREGAKFLASCLLNNGFDIPYSYRPLHGGLGHAFVNSVLYLDMDRKGFPYPVVPFTVNATTTTAIDEAVNADQPGDDPKDHVFFVVDEDVCTRCALCIDRCPTGVIILGKVTDQWSDGDPHARDNRHGYAYGVRF